MVTFVALLEIWNSVVLMIGTYYNVYHNSSLRDSSDRMLLGGFDSEMFETKLMLDNIIIIHAIHIAHTPYY